MMSNAQMTPGRFQQWAKARKLFAAITERLSQPNGLVQVSTMTRSTVYRAKHLSMFSHDKTGVYVQTGKKKVCINYCGFRFGKEV